MWGGGDFRPHTSEKWCGGGGKNHKIPCKLKVSVDAGVVICLIVKCTLYMFVICLFAAHCQVIFLWACHLCGWVGITRYQRLRPASQNMVQTICARTRGFANRIRYTVYIYMHIAPAEHIQLYIYTEGFQPRQFRIPIHQCIK